MKKSLIFIICNLLFSNILAGNVIHKQIAKEYSKKHPECQKSNQNNRERQECKKKFERLKTLTIDESMRHILRNL